MTEDEVGDDQAVLAGRQHLGPLLAGIDDPLLQAVSKLAMAWTAPVVGDLDGALRGALASLEQLRGQDAPFWTALALGTPAWWRQPWATTTPPSGTCARRAT